MGSLKVSRRPSKSPQVGDLRTLIKIWDKPIGAPIFGSASFGKGANLIAEVWASVTTATTQEITMSGTTITFDGVQIPEDTTDIYMIRYRSDIEYKHIVEFDGKNFKILKTHDPERRKRWLFIYCSELGDSDLPVNQ